MKYRKDRADRIYGSQLALSKANEILERARESIGRNELDEAVKLLEGYRNTGLESADYLLQVTPRSDGPAFPTTR